MQEEGKKTLVSAYNKGSVKSAEFFAIGYKKGINGLRRDLSLSRQWHKRAAEMGSVDSMLALGHLYRKGENVEKDLKEAYKWYESGDYRNHAGCQFNLGLMYGRGHGVSTDYNKCAEYLIKARDNPNTTEYIIGCCKDKLAMLNYDGRRWTKKMFAKI